MVPSSRYSAKANISNTAFVQLKRIHSLNLQCNVPVTSSPSATAELLVTLKQHKTLVCWSDVTTQYSVRCMTQLLVCNLYVNYTADLSGYEGVASGVLLDSRNLPRSKRMQPIEYGTKHKIVLTYREVNKSKMSKRQWYFHPQNSHVHCILLRKYTQLRTRQNKTSDSLQSAACKQSDSHVKIQTLAVSTPERLERARSGSFWTHEILLRVS